MKKEEVEAEEPVEEEVYEEEQQFQPIPPQPELGFRPNQNKELMEYRLENHPLHTKGDKVSGDVPGWLKNFFPFWNNKNVVSSNIDETKYRSQIISNERLKRKLIMFMPENEKDAKFFIDLEGAINDNKLRLTQSIDGFGQKEMNSQYQISLIGNTNQDPNQQQPQMRPSK